MQEFRSESQADIRETVAAGPLCPQKRTSLCVIGTSTWCQTGLMQRSKVPYSIIGAVGRFTNFHREGKGAGKILSMPCRTTA
jgi:hypothetical protein